MLRLSQTNVGYWITTTAGFGMTLFFVLSGFVIHYNYRELCGGRASGIGYFLWARFARLYPLFFAFFALELVFGREVQVSLSNGHPTPLMSDMLAAAPYYLLLMQSWFYVPGAEHALVYQFGGAIPLTWSISTEWFFYIVYPLIAVMLFRTKRFSFVAVVAFIWSIVWALVAIKVALLKVEPWAVDRYGPIAAVATGFQDSFYRWLLYFSPYLRIGEFVLGCLVAQIYVLLRNRAPSDTEDKFGIVLLFVGVVTLIIMQYVMYVPTGSGIIIRLLSYNFGLAPSIALIIFCSARYRLIFSRFLSRKPFVALGDASYSIYLVHFVVLLHAANGISGLPITKTELALRLLQLTLSLGVILVVSLGLHRYVEAPCRRWLRSQWPSEVDSRKPRAARLAVLAGAPVAVSTCIILVLWTNRAGVDAGKLHIIAASYGSNCGASKLNATGVLRQACDGKTECHYIVDVGKLGDPAGGCAKSFVVQYSCPRGPRMEKALPAEAGMRSPLDLSCPVEGEQVRRGDAE
jgi:peptidoglycan/LPS O-acetylase OafA/YrhL